MLRLCYNNQTAFNRTQCLNVFRCCTPLDCYGYSTLAEPVGTSNPPRKPRRWMRKFLLATLFTTVSAAGLLYTSQYFRGLLTDRYPKAAPILNRVKNFLGGWYDEHDALLSTSSTGDAFLPSFYDPTEDSDASSLPTVEDVVKMTQERSRRVISPKTLHDTENEMAEATRAVRAAMRSLAELEGATRNHIDGLRDAIKAPDSSKTKEKMWDQVSHLSALKDKAETKANAAVEEATKRLGALRESINQHKLNDESLEAEWLPKGLKAHGTLQYDLSGSIYEVRKLQNELHMLMRYRDLISKTHGTLQKDLHSIWESTDLNKLSKDASSLSVGELNSLIVVAHNRIGQLQAMLADAEERENARLNSALEAQRRADEGLIVDYVNRELERERNAHELDRLRWEAEAREATQRELQVALARHSENLAQMLSFNKSEMEHQFAYRMREALAQERTAFEAALSGWTKRMEAIEDVIDGRTELDRISKETQALWIACEALASNLSSTSPTIIEHSSQPGATFTGPLKDFLEAIEESASTGDYPFAMSILQQIPSEVSQNGVWLERGLKERFEKVLFI
ncbi:unnamed protein product [Dicrocoelium dendriticum]|nr:unnamed protein product [Dicrocoelium dendriticum]